MMHLTLIAQICHEANRIYCASIGDHSQPPWATAPAWQRNSAIDGVTFHVEHPDAMPEDSHKSWLETKEKDGWKYGEVKDPDKKEHPCMVPFDELPEDQQMKDIIFTTICRGLVPTIGRNQE